MNRKLSLKSKFFLFLLLLSGCFGSSPTVRYYGLSSLNREQVSDGIVISSERIIAVPPVTIPEYLNRSGMVRLKGENEIEVSEIEQWAESLSDAITRNLIENLSITCGCNQFNFQPLSESGNSTARLVIDFERFEKTGMEVVLRARWMLREHLSPEKDFQHLTIYTEALEVPTASEEARALSSLLQKFAQEICKEASK